jgi:hypothetical protein
MRLIWRRDDERAEGPAIAQPDDERVVKIVRTTHAAIARNRDYMREYMQRRRAARREAQAAQAAEELACAISRND